MTDPFGPLHPPMDDGWGLTWSERWHFITFDGERTGARAACGAHVYTQDAIKAEKRPAHLLAIVEGKCRAATCKKCVKHLERADL